MDGILLGPLLLFSSVMSLTPGPNVVMVTASAANFGFRPVIPHMLGITLGFGLLVMAVGLGLAGLFQAEPRLHLALRYLGGTYLLYLAWRIATASGSGGGTARAKPIRSEERRVGEECRSRSSACESKSKYLSQVIF